jgi:hypothetical protein
MTVAENIFDKVTVNVNDIRLAILNNKPIEENLHVIICISNPCEYESRYILTKEFIQRMKNELHVILYVVELAYKNQEYIITEEGNPRHLQLRTEVPIWHKENLINCGIRLLPSDWKAFAWVDADIEFESWSWALDTLKILNGSRDIVQVFSHCVDMDENERALNIFQSFGLQYAKGQHVIGKGINYWHCGYGWAMTRAAYEKIGSLYDVSILGAGDHNMALAIIGRAMESLNRDTTEDYKNSLGEFEKKASNLRFGYVPGVIRHHFHGCKKDRKYMERWRLLVDNKFEPSKHVTHNKDGILVPTKECPSKLLYQILQYFKQRNEDYRFQKLTTCP